MIITTFVRCNATFCEMPWNYRDYLQLGLLICCVPLQFYLSHYVNFKSNSKQEVLALVNELRHIKDSWFSLTFWKNSWTNFLSWFVINVLGIQKEIVDESPAVEVIEFRKKYGLRGKSNKIQESRPKDVWFRVGQVVEHIYEDYRGVIVEWEINPKKSNLPIYTILVDEVSVEDHEFTGMVEVEQDQLFLLQNTQIKNRFLKNYFSTFDGSQYIPQPWLQQLYPRD